jgi:hypothetical protein
LKYLNSLEDRPWKKLTPHALGIILRNFPIPHTGSQRIGDANFKGFTFRHFVESWQRYLPHLSCQRSTQIVNNNPALEDHNLCAGAGDLRIGTGVPEIGTSEGSIGATEVSIGTNPSSIGTNEASIGTNSHVETTIPNVFNVCADQSINSHSFQPEQVSASEQAAGKDRQDRQDIGAGGDSEDGNAGKDQCATASPSLPGP